MSRDFQLFTSLRHDDGLRQVPTHGPQNAGWNHRIESPYYILDYHRDRMLRAATHWAWPDAIQILEGEAGLERLASFLDTSLADHRYTARVKILLAQDGRLACEKGPAAPVPLSNLFPSWLPVPDAEVAAGDPSKTPVYKIVPDTALTSKSEYTHFKTTERAVYDDARSRAGIQLTDTTEVLVVNKTDGSIMEGSLTTPYFFRNGRWVTPPVPQKFSWESGSGGQDGTTRRWALERGIAIEEAVLADSLAGPLISALPL
ncbi:uncharacterized protein VDAG_00280 [Verticillium dahliae VdLs.17]|uniref:Aminodeoxychorismate lyase n=1 Tax=Verticillium dahliae (strain VdLs.17 / ATCC MYA-4575 / FGSC 10137) TaxID=498257 RepID=G2WRU7_VERDV|nr:uncharacterized protein VDAG_00280 [Verticillium dahliae VdLs.17]EGY13598.1 hypothetical protein VDAG_00280 [Verticillium dahliae VdLs.17]KAH6710051.1 hypothetical protein EV126DRAFT_375325 [Verticillium dahliae]